MKAWAIGWTRGGPLLIRDVFGEWGRADDPELVPRIYAAEQFAKNSIRQAVVHEKHSPLYIMGVDPTIGWQHARPVELDIRIRRPTWREAFKELFPNARR